MSGRAGAQCLFNSKYFTVNTVNADKIAPTMEVQKTPVNVSDFHYRAFVANGLKALKRDCEATTIKRAMYFL